MKKFAGLVIILAALILGGYYGMGVLTERTIRKNIQVIDQQYNGLYAEIIEYHRGLFTSKAKIKWRLHVPEHVVKDTNGTPQVFSAQDYNMEMPLAVSHGPIIFNPRLRFGFGYAEAFLPFPPQYYGQFDAQFTKDSIKPQLNLNIFINYINESTVNIKVPTFNLIANDKSGRFDWMGLDASTTISSGLKKVKGQIILSGLEANKDDSKIVLSKVSSEYDLHETSAGLYLGDANFSLPSFDVLVKNQKIFSINELLVKSDSDIQEHLFNTHFNVTVKSVLANGQNYGPGELDIALRNLDADVLAKINQQTSAMQNGDETQRQQAMLALLPELPKIFDKGAEFEISKLSLKIPQGLMEGKLHIALPKGENANPFELIQKLQGSAKFQIPSETLKQIMQQTAKQQLIKQPDLQQSLMQQVQKGEVTGQPSQKESPAANPTTNQRNQPASVQNQGSSPANQPAAPTIEQLAAIQAEKEISSLQQTGFLIAQGSDYIIEVSLNEGKITVNGKPFDFSMIKF